MTKEQTLGQVSYEYRLQVLTEELKKLSKKAEEYLAQLEAEDRLDE